jgi:hypothetical protein
MNRRLPKQVKTILGTSPVEVRELRKNLLGRFGRDDRVIGISKSLPLDVQWHTLLHEVMEAAMWDSGVNQILQEDVKEAVCDAAATGFLRFMQGLK